MNKVSRVMIERMRQRGFRVLFQINHDASICVTAISPKREAYIVQGRLCEDSRLIDELARMVRLDEQPSSDASDSAGPA